MKPRSGRLYGGVNPHPFEYSNAIVESPWAWRSRPGVYAGLGPLCSVSSNDAVQAKTDIYFQGTFFYLFFIGAISMLLESFITQWVASLH